MEYYCFQWLCLQNLMVQLNNIFVLSILLKEINNQQPLVVNCTPDQFYNLRPCRIVNRHPQIHLKHTFFEVQFDSCNCTSLHRPWSRLVKGYQKTHRKKNNRQLYPMDMHIHETGKEKIFRRVVHNQVIVDHKSKLQYRHLSQQDNF